MIFKYMNDIEIKEPVALVVEDEKGRPLADELVEGPVVAILKNSIFVDLQPYGTGIIYGREYINARDVIKKINIGDSIKAKVVEAENEDGYIELSLREAKQAVLWHEAEIAMKDKTVFELAIKEANKGGLIVEWQGIEGFLPASQLKPEHYPRVEDSDKDKILKELKKVVGVKLSLNIIAVNPKDGKLIFSEKETSRDDKNEAIGKYSVGDEVATEVSGIVEFGVFLKLEEGIEGLVHISELDWGLVDDPRSFFKLGDKIKAKIIEVKEGKISLSIKALKENPWKTFEGKLKKGDIMKGIVVKYNKHGALVSIKEGVAGLVHNSQFGTEEKLRENLSIGKTYNFQVTLFEPKDQKMSLVFLEEKK